jgi:hypothetical protein
VGGMVLKLGSHSSYQQMLHSRRCIPLVSTEEGLHGVGKQHWWATHCPEFVVLHTFPACPSMDPSTPCPLRKRRMKRPCCALLHTKH